MFLVQIAAILKLELPREAGAACQLEVLGIKRPWSTGNRLRGNAARLLLGQEGVPGLEIQGFRITKCPNGAEINTHDRDCSLFINI